MILTNPTIHRTILPGKDRANDLMLLFFEVTGILAISHTQKSQERTQLLGGAFIIFSTYHNSPQTIRLNETLTKLD